MVTKLRQDLTKKTSKFLIYLSNKEISRLFVSPWTRSSEMRIKVNTKALLKQLTKTLKKMLTKKLKVMKKWLIHKVVAKMVTKRPMILLMT